MFDNGDYHFFDTFNVPDTKPKRFCLVGFLMVLGIESKASPMPLTKARA
jgi:hypothetical protein